MTDDVLFAVAPYAASAMAIAALVLRLARWRADQPLVDRTAPRAALVACVVVASAAVVGVLHMTLLAAARLVLMWNRDASRLIVLEAGAAAAGVVCSIAAVAVLVRQIVHRAEVDNSLGRTAALTLVAIANVSGVVLAIVYRWASSWSAVTLTPYVQSLARLRPRVELISATPAIVRLHLLCAFATIALLPFTDVGSLVIAALSRLVAAAAPLTKSIRLARPRVDEGIDRLLRQPLWGEEEN